ncbi:MAG: transcriptional repressor LexA [Candidatus Krumholzibacteriia bacterium]
MSRTIPGTTRRRVYAYVRDRVLAGSPPTTREVQEYLGFRAVQSARQHLERLVAEGRLTKQPGVARGYGLPASSVGGAEPVPIVGRVQAGRLSEAIEEPDGFLAVEGRAPGEVLFALTVRGESMIGAGILPGDMVVVRRQELADDGAVVVAMVDGEATVKRLRIRHGRVELHAENQAFAPIVPARPGDVRIVGQVVEVRRRLG